MSSLRDAIRTAHIQPEQEALRTLLDEADFSDQQRQAITSRAVELVQRIREDSDPVMMELFLAEYGLSSDEGVALMCLAEALLRVPDGATMDALIEDKIAPSKWNKHLGHSHSSLVNASTWALFITGKVLDDSKNDTMAGLLHGLIKRLGEPVIRQAVTRVMKELGGQFVLGETIGSAMQRAKEKEKEGFTYSYDMLGEAARTQDDAHRYHIAYSEAISQIAKARNGSDIRKNPGISIKLSALHPRYETIKRQRVMEELVPQARSLAVLARSAGIGLNIDAEEAERLDISLDVIEAILSDPVLKDWDGFGVVVQAYGQRAPLVLDWLYDLANQLDRKIMVRLVKGAYWDTEVKIAQEKGLEGFPVYTQKSSTDVSYICCAKKLLSMTDRIYPQFATHNAHTVAAILEMADDKSAFEFQRLHGMGEALHDTVQRRQGTRCRIYAPVGAHRELLAYLVRRLLENGANSSFVNQIVDESVSPDEVAKDPFENVLTYLDAPHNPQIRFPNDLFLPQRKNSKGFDLQDPITLQDLKNGLQQFESIKWAFNTGSGEDVTITNPATEERVGTSVFCTKDDVARACSTVRPWTGADASQRARILRSAADAYEQNALEIFSLLQREAGKTLLDCVGELREAVDFLRYYAAQCEENSHDAMGVFACISPWNFPLAIFTGQISAALAAGNGVLAKPAETTPLIAGYAVSLLHKAGVPDESLTLLPGTGAQVGAALTSNPVVDGVCFTGSTLTAQIINRSMAQNLAPTAPLIAETGGLNAMIVDSTALPEQAVGDILASAFQSAGQRCSALRILYLQEDIAEPFLKMLQGAMDELHVGNPQDFETDVGPVIDRTAQQKIMAHIDVAMAEGRVLKKLPCPQKGIFVPPTLISVSGIDALKEEIFGPVLHVATFKNHQFDQILNDINNQGYGLTFGLHSRIDDRVQHVIDKLEVGNIYINRNQIGAIVGSQPFGGEGLSGTGPKAGGPRYLSRFYKTEKVEENELLQESKIEEFYAEQIKLAFEKINISQSQLSELQLPGPTGESNTYSTDAKSFVLCLGPSAQQAEHQAKEAQQLGCRALAVAPGVKDGLDGTVSLEALKTIEKLDAVVSWSNRNRHYRQALSQREGALVPLYNDADFTRWLIVERHACVDTTAAGGNAALIGA